MENTDNSEWDAIVAKLISGSVLFIVSVISGVIPFKLATVFKWTEPLDANGEKKTNKTVNILLCFGGGVLLATTFLHLLPEINHTIAWLVEEGLLPKMSFNLGELLMMAGFFLIYLIEELVHGYLHRHQNRKKKEELNSDDGLSDTIMRGISARNSAHKLDFSKDKDFALPENEVNRTHSSHGHSHIMPLPSNEDFLVSSLRGLLIVLALSIHELFEGFAVGLEKHASGVYFMFAAVAAHKFVIAFCIGVELMVQRTKLWLAFVYVVIYSIVSAVGIAIGGILTSGSNADNLQVPNIVLQGLATGTLLYVIFFEVLSKDRSGLVPYLSVCTGFALMFGLQYVAGITENQSVEGKSLQNLHL